MGCHYPRQFSAGAPASLLAVLGAANLRQPPMLKPVYKILSEAAYEAAKREGHFSGSAGDARDGFIHLSAADQVEGTLSSHFAGQEGLLLVALDPDRLGPELKWEPSRGGALFPHLYGPLDLATVVGVEKLGLGEDGEHVVPEAGAR